MKVHLKGSVNSAVNECVTETRANVPNAHTYMEEMFEIYVANNVDGSNNTMTTWLVLNKH